LWQLAPLTLGRWTVPQIALMCLLGVNDGDPHLATAFQQQFYYRHYLLEPLNR